MDLVCHRLYTLGELTGVWNEVARAVAGLGGPAVVNIDVGVANIFETETNESICSVECYSCGGSAAAALVLGELETRSSWQLF